jgi:transcriptional regulator with XRE-family HTH domain
MKNIEFGGYLKSIRESRGIPQRKVAQRLDIDTSTLSKIELGERPVLISMIQGLSEILEIDYRKLQIKFISNSILNDFEGQPFLYEALTELSKTFESRTKVTG